MTLATDSAQLIAMEPKIRFGKPHIEGARMID
jgi:uncharacterized protein (DUF433 family)